MKFKTSTELKRWMTAQDKAGKLIGELKIISNAVLGQWRIINRQTKAKKTIDARTVRFFRSACDRLDELSGDAGVSP